MCSHRFVSCLPAQLIMCVTLLAKMNSRSCQLVKSGTYLGRKLVTNEKSIFYFNSADHIFLHFNRWRGVHLLLSWLLRTLHKDAKALFFAGLPGHIKYIIT